MSFRNYLRYYFRRSDERTFSSQPSSIDFLKKQNFDFNKVFYEGIPFLNAEEESKMRDEVEEKQDKRRQSNSVSLYICTKNLFRLGKTLFLLVEIIHF